MVIVFPILLQYMQTLVLFGSVLFKVELRRNRYDKWLILLAMQYDGEYVGDVDCSLTLRGIIRVLIGEVPKTRYKRYYKYNSNYRKL